MDVAESPIRYLESTRRCSSMLLNLGSLAKVTSPGPVTNIAVHTWPYVMLSNQASSGPYAGMRQGVQSVKNFSTQGRSHRGASPVVG
ncbi:hypothetical protein M514_18007 [Trichuris suis]|uniref:Uncharacterized protein n=1 Tax=Trichuris suis TaxID=68888 RepID=A0A085NK89_9BILA|nr:hypothetical protein M514_18007 [Trichuris suis]